MEEAKVVVITGGAYGIGRGIAETFASQGAAVVLADLHRQRGTELQAAIEARGGRALFVATDVRDEQEIAALMAAAVERFGRIDVLCNNAGVERYKYAEAMDLEDWDAIVQTNLRGSFLCSKYAHPHLKASGGTVIFISSVQAFANEPQSSVYAATKAGILGLTRSMALDFAKDGIRVNAVCPGAIHTGMTEVYLEGQDEPQAILDKIGTAIPLGRIGKPEDVAGVVAFLASPAAAYMTGASLVVDGGLLCRLAL